MTHTADQPLFDDDILEGASEIAGFIYGDPAKKHRIQRQQDDQQDPLPLFRIRGRLYARKSQLRRWFEDQQNAARKTGAAA